MAKRRAQVRKRRCAACDEKDAEVRALRAQLKTADVELEELEEQLSRTEARLAEARGKGPNDFDELFTARKLLGSYSRRIGDLERLLEMLRPHEAPTFQSDSIWA